MANPVKTWHLCPTFDIPPPPNGPLLLGSIVVSKFKLRAPLTRSNMLPIPAHLQIESSELTGTKHAIKRSSEGKVGCFANIAQIAGLGSSVDMSSSKMTDVDYSFHKEFTSWFEPDISYLSDAAQGLLTVGWL
jgi:hypothetical protein